MTNEEKLVQEIIDAVQSALESRGLESGEGLRAEIIATSSHEQSVGKHVREVVHGCKGVQIMFRGHVPEEDEALPLVILEEIPEMEEFSIVCCPAFIGQYVEIGSKFGTLESFTTFHWKSIEYYDLVFIDAEGNKSNMAFPWTSIIRVKL